MAKAGAEISAALSQGMPLRLTTQVTASAPPNIPPYHVNPAPLKIKSHGERTKLSHSSNRKRTLAPTTTPRSTGRLVLATHTHPEPPPLPPHAALPTYRKK